MGYPLFEFKLEVYVPHRPGTIYRNIDNALFKNLAPIFYLLMA
jgi:hypothetical protein